HHPLLRGHAGVPPPRRPHRCRLGAGRHRPRGQTDPARVRRRSRRPRPRPYRLPRPVPPARPRRGGGRPHRGSRRRRPPPGRPRTRDRPRRLPHRPPRRPAADTPRRRGRRRGRGPRRPRPGRHRGPPRPLTYHTRKVPARPSTGASTVHRSPSPLHLHSRQRHTVRPVYASRHTPDEVPRKRLADLFPPEPLDTPAATPLAATTPLPEPRTDDPFPLADATAAHEDRRPGHLDDRRDPAGSDAPTDSEVDGGPEGPSPAAERFGGRSGGRFRLDPGRRGVRALVVI